MKKIKRGNEFKKPNKNVITILPLIFAAAAFLIVIYYMLGPSKGYLHSDCVDTMTWAQATVESGKLFSTTFRYPYLLPFGSTFLVYPFVKILGFTMFAYRLSMIVFLLLFTAALYFMLRGMKWNRNWVLITVCIELITVSSSVKLRELFWEHIIHYSLGAFLAFVLLALCLYFINTYYENKNTFGKNKKVIIYAVLIGIWAFFSAFDGVTTLALSSIPVIGGLLIAVVFDTDKKIFSKENKSLFISTVIVICATGLGGLTLSAVSRGIPAGYGSAYSVISDSSEWSENALKFLKHWTSLLGADYKIGASITEADNIFVAVKMAGSLVLFLVPVYGIFIFEKFNRNERVVLLFHWLMTAFILYGYVFGNLSSVNWRLSPIICSAVVVNVTVWKQLWAAADKKRVCTIIASLVVLSCVITVGQIATMPANYGSNSDKERAIELLERNNLTYGYATYWNANILTLLSSSKVKVRDVNFDESNPRKGWLNTDNAWYDEQPGQNKYFVLFTSSEYDDMVDRNHIILENTERVIKEGNWVVLVKGKNIF